MTPEAQRIDSDKITALFEATFPDMAQGAGADWSHTLQTVRIATANPVSILQRAYHESMHAFFSNVLEKSPEAKALMLRTFSTPAMMDRMAALQGLGDARLRKEDARFIQGKGNYVDDIKLPGMVHMDIVRSSIAHGRIKKIDKSEALKVPGVIAVLTADDLKPLKRYYLGDQEAIAAAMAAVASQGKAK
jgi:hypothetical protein